MTILVTGGAGFIGSNFLHHITRRVRDEEIICIDKLTYAGNWEYIPDSVVFYTLDIASKEACDYVFLKHKIKTIFNFAAETHVDNSIKDCSRFIETNIKGTVNLLNLSMKYDVEKFIHISTDEVYGSIEEGQFTEETIYNPRNPYSASKAASDHFVMAYHNTYDIPAIITNCSNNYGPRQNSEKFIPKAITNLLQGKKIPVYGDGKQIRDWLYVKDHCTALSTIAERGRTGEKYNIGGECEVENIELVKMILEYMNFDESMIEYVKDRPGHDRRYSTDISKIKNTLGWSPAFKLENSLKETIEWYKNEQRI
jgi:dTDP-glucose 4,6-dehydratase